MLELRDWAKEAKEKLDSEKKTVSGQKEKIMAGQVLTSIKMFCEQNGEFAQAVVQGGSFADCMKKVASGVGNSISDIDAYKKAVQFYFPGAEIQMQMTIDLIGEANKEEPMSEEKNPEVEKPKLLTLDLSSFF